MNKTFLYIVFFFTTYTFSQSLTKEESLEELKNTLQGQIIHYFYGEPCKNHSGSSIVFASKITVNSVKFHYSQIIVEYTYTDKETFKIIKRINMNNDFVIYSNGLFETKKELTSDNITCDDVENLALTFDNNAKPAQERALNILKYLKKFKTKDPFENN